MTTMMKGIIIVNKMKISLGGNGLDFVSALGLIFVTLKLCNVIDWPWVWVLAPFWIGIIVVLIIVAIFILIVR